MNDNVVRFERPKQPKPPRQMPPGLRRLLVIAAVILAFAAAWAWFQFGAAKP